MMKKLYYVRTNGYDMLVSQDNDNNIRYLTENKYFPSNDSNDNDILAFLRSVEDDTSWELEENVEDLEEWLNIDGHLGDASVILAEIEKEL